jgi:DNA-binding PucR family transcriptional regulator
MAKITQITSISIRHGKTARVVELAITIKTITPKTITIR